MTPGISNVTYCRKIQIESRRKRVTRARQKLQAEQEVARLINKKAKKRDDDIDMTHVNEVLRSDVEAAKETLRKEEEALEGARMEEEEKNYEIKIRLPLQQD